MSESQSRQCFVLMPFAEHYREVYSLVYKPVCEANSVDCWRVDEIARPGSITRDIVQGILDADLIIADLTSRNPNVFYELGISHSVGNKTIMTAQHADDVPFDIAAYRVLFYDQTIAGAKALSKALDSAIKELLKSLDQTNNPVQEVLAGRTTLGIPKRTPLVRISDHRTLGPNLMKMIVGEDIVFADQLGQLRLAEMKVKYGLGKTSLERLVGLLLEHELYGDIDELNRFIRENKLRTTSTGRW